MRALSATEARVHFGEMLRRVAEEGEAFTVERGGKPLAVVLAVAEYQRLLGEPRSQADWWADLDKLQKQMRAEIGNREIPPADEVIRQMREERDAQIDAALRDLH